MMWDRRKLKKEIKKLLTYVNNGGIIVMNICYK